MPKLKTHKGTAKRVRKSAGGKLMHERPFRNHFMSKKRASRKRGYANQHTLGGKVVKTVKRNLGVKYCAPDLV